MDAETLVDIGVDLLEEAAHHLAFLHTVWEHQELFEHLTLSHALNRYVDMWLPLAAAREREDVEPPLDVHWVWYLHLLNPQAYHDDCIRLLGKVPSHKFHFLSQSRDSARERTKILWEKRYPNVAFDTPTEEFKSITGAPEIIDLKHIIINVHSQKMYIYQLLLPHFNDKKFQENALIRYKKYLYVRKSSPDYTAPPSGAGFDVDLMHRSHCVRPLEYHEDMMNIFSMLPDFSNKVGPGSPGLVGTPKHQPSTDDGGATARESIIKVPGAMFRGDAPYKQLTPIKEQDIYSFSHKGCDLGIKKIRMENISYKNITVIIGIARWSSLEINNHEFKSQGNPPFEWEAIGNHEDLANLDWKTEGYEQFYISAYRRMFNKGRKSKALIGCLFDKQLFESVEQADPKETKIVKNFAKTVAGHNCEARFLVSCQIRNIRRLSVELTLRRGEFEKRLLPENIREIWGPLMLQKLPPGVVNQCTFALHRLCNHKDEETMSVRVIHSLPLRMSAVEVLFREKMCACAHLIGSEQLPMPDQVSGTDIPTLDPTIGERAMIIKNNQGDWGIVKAHWSKEGGLRAKEGNVLKVDIWDLRNHCNEKSYIPIKAVRSGDCILSIMGMEIDLRLGRVKVPSGTLQVAEHVSLAFSVVMLFHLCVPSFQVEKKQLNLVCSCGEEEKTVEEMQFMLATGYREEIPSNDWLNIGRLGPDIRRLDSTAWKEVGIPEKKGPITMYCWKRPEGPDSRQESFEIDVSFGGPGSGFVNRSFDSASENLKMQT